jgi:putative lipoprotein
MGRLDFSGSLFMGYAWNFPREKDVARRRLTRFVFVFINRGFPMHKMVLLLTSVAALSLAGCGGSSSSQQADAGASPSTAGAPAAAASGPANEVSGTIALRGAGQLSPNATLVVNLVDVSASAAGSAPLASKTAPAGSFPQPFKLTFNSTEVKPNDLYVVQASLTDGDRHYVMPIQAPVLTKGNKHGGITVELLAEQTPGEKVQASFDDVQKQIGGMKVANGTRLGKDISRGWQVFRQGGEVKFIRELVDYGAKGFTSTDYAYKGGKLWAAVQQKKPSKDAKATETDSVGWDDSGALVLKQQKAADGSTKDLDADAATSLRKQGVDILDMATGGKKK